MGYPNELYEAIQTAINGINDILPDVAQEVFVEIEKLLSELTLVDGNVVTSLENLKTVSRIRGKIDTIITKNELYNTHIGKYVDTFGDIGTMQQRYFDEVFGSVGSVDILKEVQRQTISTTVNSLTRAGISANLSEPIHEILRQNVTTGTGFFDLTKTLREYILGNSASVGHLEKYVNQITTDAINQYAGETTKIMSADLGVEWFLYPNHLIVTSRQFCIAMVRKQYYHKRELPELIKGHFEQFRALEGTINQRTKLPNGMVMGTNPENFLGYRGGYHCNHQPIPVSEGMVPRKMREVTYKKFGIPFDDKGFKIRGGKGTQPNQ